MRPIDADALFNKVKTECNPYGKPTIGFEDGKRVMSWIKQAPTVSGWVSVNDRLPDPDIDVLLNVHCNWSGDYYQVIAWRTKMGDWDSNDDGFNQNDDYITHWMLLPEPPEEVKGDA